MTTPDSLAGYYARRAKEYERIYAKPERQTDLAKLRSILQPAFAGANVLELACGTGYWTAVMATSAASVLATDINEEGNTYQTRRLEDQSTCYEVLKNFPSEAELRAAIAGLADRIQIQFLPYYWILSYRSLGRALRE